MTDSKISEVFERLESRLDQIENKLDNLRSTHRKSLEWVGTVSEHIESLDAFRQEVRVSFEPVLGKLENVDEVSRILRHAMVDLSRRLEKLEANGS